MLPKVSLDINAGDFIAISGSNGGGKTTLLRIILDLLKPSTGKVIYFNNNKQVSYISTGYLPQKNSIDSHFPMTVEQVIESGLLSAFHRNFSQQDYEAVKLISDYLNIAELKNHVLDELSGGQVQRALVARALVARPQLLVLDEPFSYLDTEYGDRLEHLLEDLHGVATIIMVSHRQERIKRLATRHWHVDNGITEQSF